MPRRSRTVRDMRLEHEAAEARGLIRAEPASSRSRSPRTEPAARPRPANQPRLKVVWAVCDIGGRTVASFDYPEKAAAEALAADLKRQGKGPHFVRSEKVPMG